MHKISFTSEIDVYPNLSDLDEQGQALLKKAKETAAGAYAPYSKFKVGAALLLNNGLIVVGSNQENAAYPLTMCAERNALYSAGSQYPNEPVKRLAITIISGKQQIFKPVSPCGACRQVIYEYETRFAQDIELLLQGDAGEVYVLKSVKTILPLLFDASYL